jgi:hypothetical protein
VLDPRVWLWSFKSSEGLSASRFFQLFSLIKWHVNSR